MSIATVSRIRNAAPFGPGAQPPPNPPPNQYGLDQPQPAPAEIEFRTGYHDRTLRSFSAPLAFENWSIERIRNAIALHDQGLFLESSLLAIITSRFGPVFAALSQAIAPALALPRHINGGTRGLSRLLREEVESQLAPRQGLAPSPYFPPTLWGSCALDLRQQGFAVLQHVYGDEDPETGVRPIYTRRWPTWAVQYQRYRRTFVALTTDRPIDIISGDGKFTLLADTEEPHFDGAIRALGLEVLDGALVKQARASYIDRYGNPKWIGIMPEKTAVRSPEGDAMFEAMETIQGPDGWGVIPHGGDYKTAEMSAAQGSVFKDALDNVWMYCAAILLGSDGTMTRGTGVYSAPIFAGVRRDLIDRMLKAMVRGINLGHVAPWLHFNFAASIAAAGGWIDPVLDIPLPDPDADARIKSRVERDAAVINQVKLEREQGFVVSQERVNQIAESYDVDPPTLAATGPIDQWMIETKLAAPDELRAARGMLPLPDGMGGIEQLAKERATGKDQISGRGVTGFDATKAASLIELGRTVGLQPSTEGVAEILAEAGLGSQPIAADAAPAARIDLAPTDMAKIVTVDEARAANRLDPIGDERGDKMIAEIGAGAGEPAPPGGPGGETSKGDVTGVNDGRPEGAALAAEGLILETGQVVRAGDKITLNAAMVRVRAGSPDQPRAPDGKFGSGGGNSSSDDEGNEDDDDVAGASANEDDDPNEGDDEDERKASAAAALEKAETRATKTDARAEQATAKAEAAESDAKTAREAADAAAKERDEAGEALEKIQADNEADEDEDGEDDRQRREAQAEKAFERAESKADKANERAEGTEERAQTAREKADSAEHDARLNRDAVDQHKEYNEILAGNPDEVDDRVAAKRDEAAKSVDEATKNEEAADKNLKSVDEEASLHAAAEFHIDPNDDAASERHEAAGQEIDKRLQEAETEELRARREREIMEERFSFWERRAE